MTEKTRSLIIKILVIIGFSATILLIAWLLMNTVRNTPDIFSRLASIVREKESAFEDDSSVTPTESAPTPTESTPPRASSTPSTPRVSTPDASHTPPYTPPRIVYPTSNPYGYTDLKITIHGIGTFRNGIFGYTSAYTRTGTYVMLVEIENLGTKTSSRWSFETYIEDDVHHTSGIQAPLKPKEHIVFTLPFTAPRTARTIDIDAEVYTDHDSDLRNNTDTLTRDVE